MSDMDLVEKSCGAMQKKVEDEGVFVPRSARRESRWALSRLTGVRRVPQLDQVIIQ